ncbi:hypothetical protein COLO4_33591 [Corchorus olitorius]|uniref:Uncharacterized protein n=1 Tax=Corchorus olitorius TaxID=93759 RepID=A0A1R3GSF8_9ROSI|nr:hypothetical protein COLO4_33591 [Corchorus olitorius]
MKRKRMAAENQRISRENYANHGNRIEDPSSQGNSIENTTHREIPSGSRPNPSGSRLNPQTHSPNNSHEDDQNVAVSSQGGNSNNSNVAASSQGGDSNLNSNGPALDHH